MTVTSRIVTVLLSILLLSACGSVRVGRDFDVTAFTSKIEPGVTTQGDVRAWLGAPASVGVSLATDGERYDEWAYYFIEGEISDMNLARMKMLQVKFDRQGKARGYNWSTSR